MYIRTQGNDSSGSKLNSLETVKKELGKVIGDEAGYLRKIVGAKEWYHVVKQKIFKRAFVSPFEAMGVLMMANEEKEPMFQIMPGTAGKKRRSTPHSTS